LNDPWFWFLQKLAQFSTKVSWRPQKESNKVYEDPTKLSLRYSKAFGCIGEGWTFLEDLWEFLSFLPV